MDEGALIEPWVVGVYAVDRGQVTLGHKCAIIGAGAIGVMVFLAAKLAGAVDICVVGERSEIVSFVHRLLQKNCNIPLSLPVLRR